MKRIYLIGLGLLLALLLLATGALLMLRQRGAGGYDVQGRVAGFSNDPHRVIVEHEAIDGYMPAMTMPFTAADSAQLGDLDVGDAVGFRLRTGADSAWITGVERLPDSAVARHPAAATSPVRTLDSEQAVLQRGARVPGFTLSQNQNGRTVRLADYQGQVLVLTFIYTQCPIPDYCPLMSQKFAQLQDLIPPKLDGEVELLSVSFDPERDTPPVLRDYAARYTDDLSNWTFATGTEQEVQRVTGLFGVFTEQGDGQIMHSLTTAVIGSDGQVKQIWRGNDWAPQEVLAEARRALGPEAG